MAGRRVYVFLGTFWLLTQLMSVNTAALNYPSKQIGQDISWPNCHYLNLAPASYGIVGVTGGLSFMPNPCINAESILYRQNLSLYVNSGFPGEPYDLKFQNTPLKCRLSDVNCMAYNFGFNSGLYAFNYALKQGIVSNNWWIDLESDNSWTTNFAVNSNSLIGEFDAIVFASKATTIGFYSYPATWTMLVGKWTNELPVWQATDGVSKIMAEKTCLEQGFTGQKPTLVQYLNTDQTLDLDYSCQ